MIDSGWGADPRPRQMNDRQAKFPTGFQVRWMIDSESPAILVVTVLWAGGDDWISMDDRLGLGQGRKSLAAETRPQGPGSFPPIPRARETALDGSLAQRSCVVRFECSLPNRD